MTPKLDLGDKRLLNIKELMAYTDLGRARAGDYGRKAGAVVRVGRRLLFNRAKIDDYTNKESGK